jgi:TonB family protein
MKYNNTNLINNQDLKSDDMVTPVTRKRIRKIVIITHLAVVIIPLTVLLVYKWFKPKPPERIRVRLVQPQPANSIKKSVKQPTPQKKKPKKVTKPKLKKKIVKKTKPKRKILSANDIIISKDVIKPKTQKKLSSKDLEKKILKNWQKVKYPVKTTQKYNSKITAAYSSTVGAYLKPIWNQPEKASLGGRAPEVTISINIDGNGRVINSRIIRRSGIAVMDNSVIALLKKLKNVPQPPDRQAKSVTIIMAVEN